MKLCNLKTGRKKAVKPSNKTRAGNPIYPRHNFWEQPCEYHGTIRYTRYGDFILEKPRKR